MSHSVVKVFINSQEFSLVLEFNIEGFRQEKTQTPSNNGDDAVYQHGDGVMVDVQQPDQRSEDARHTGKHGVQTDTILPASIDNGDVSPSVHATMANMAYSATRAQ